jgi:hypothetical protein
MPQLASLVLKDHAGTDHTFIPKGIDGGVATTVLSTGVPIGEKIASFSVSKSATGKRKCLLKMALPVVQDVVVSGISKPTVVRTSYAEISFNFDPTSNTAERQDALAYAISFLKDTGQIAPLVEDLAAPF